MTDLRSPATIQADIEMIGLELIGTDLIGDLSHLPMLSPIDGISRIEFVDTHLSLLAAVESDTSIPAIGMQRAVRALAEVVAADQNRQFIQDASVIASGDAATLRIAVSLAPFAITLDGIKQGLYCTERLQAFEMAHRDIDPETLPAEQCEAVNLVRDTLGIE